MNNKQTDMKPKLVNHSGRIRAEVPKEGRYALLLLSWILNKANGRMFIYEHPNHYLIDNPAVCNEHFLKHMEFELLLDEFDEWEESIQAAQ